MDSDRWELKILELRIICKGCGLQFVWRDWYNQDCPVCHKVYKVDIKVTEEERN